MNECPVCRYPNPASAVRCLGCGYYLPELKDKK